MIIIYYFYCCLQLLIIESTAVSICYSSCWKIQLAIMTIKVRIAGQDHPQVSLPAVSFQLWMFFYQPHSRCIYFVVLMLIEKLQIKETVHCLYSKLLCLLINFGMLFLLLFSWCRWTIWLFFLLALLINFFLASSLFHQFKHNIYM